MSSYEDSRARVPLVGKTIDLAQLAAEVGAALCASDTEVVVAEDDSTVTASALQKALDAHSPTTPHDRAAEFDAAIKAATTLAGLKDALLGTTGPGVEPRRDDST